MADECVGDGGLVAKKTFHLRSPLKGEGYRPFTVTAWREADGRLRLDFTGAGDDDPAFRAANPGAAGLFSLIDVGMDAGRLDEIAALVRGEQTRFYRGSIAPDLIDATQAVVREARERMPLPDGRALAASIDAKGFGKRLAGWEDRLALSFVSGAVDAMAMALADTVLAPTLQAKFGDLLSVLADRGDHIELGPGRCGMAVGLDVMRIAEEAGATFRPGPPSVLWRNHVAIDVEVTCNGRTEVFRVETVIGHPSAAVALAERWHIQHAGEPQSIEWTREYIRDWSSRFDREGATEEEIEAEAVSMVEWFKAERERLAGLLGSEAFARAMAVAPAEAARDALS